MQSPRPSLLIWSLGGGGRARLGAFFAGLAWMLVCSVGLCQPAAPPGQLTIDEALAVASDAPHFPGPAASGPAPVTVHLPDDWSTTRPGYSGGVWYRVGFVAHIEGATREVLALNIERACSNLQVDLNGARVYTTDLPHGNATRSCHSPRRVLLPATLFKPEGNWLDVHIDGTAAERVASRRDVGGVSVWQIGEQADIAALHKRQYFWRIQLVQLTATALFALGAVLLWLGWLHGRDPPLLWFGGFCCGWSLLAARIWLQASPFDADWTDRLLTAFGAPVAAMAVQFLLCYAKVRVKQVDWALIAQCAVLPATLWLAGVDHLADAARFWDMLLALEVLAAALVCLRTMAARRPTERTAMTMLFVAATALLVTELAFDRPPSFGPALNLMHTLLPLLLMVIGVHLLRTYAAALRSAEAGRQSLEERVAQITDEIERNFAQLAEMRVEQVTDRERKRIAADLHDDLGAKLLTIVHTSESDRISTLAREALEEMRLSVRGLTSKPVRLVDALADWRAEIVSRLGQTNIDTDWRSPPDETDDVLSARAYVQTTRILREAVSNIIKHSGATHCKVRVLVGEQDFAVTVQDNGRGIPLEVDGRLDRGHGMASMKHRAKQLRGQCLVESGPGYGTVIRVTLPL